MLRAVHRVGVAAMAVLLLAGCGSGSTAPATSNKPAPSKSSAPDPAAFYKGKTLTIIVPSGAGGGYDTYARLVAKYIQQPLGVANVIVKNESAGGGVVASNDLYAAAPDGLTIGDGKSVGMVFDTIFHASGINYQVDKYNWLGEPDQETRVLVFGPGGPGAPKGGYTSFSQVMALKNTSKKVYLLTSGVGAPEYYGLIDIFNAFGIPFHMIAAYTGSKESTAALLRGDGSVTVNGYGSLHGLITGGKAAPFAQITMQRSSELPNTPTVLELAQQNNLPQKTVGDLQTLTEVMAMGHPFAAPPGIPAARLAFLENAFKVAVTNPDFVAAASKAKLSPHYSGPDVISQAISSGLAAANDLRGLGTAH